MTNKEAKEKLYMEWQKFLENNIDYAGISEAYKIAFKALEQEPSGDNVVSRDVVKEQMIMYGFHAPDMTVTEFVEDLPPVNPKEPTTINGLDDFIEFGKKAFGVELTIKKSDNPDTYAKLFGTTKNDLAVDCIVDVLGSYTDLDIPYKREIAENILTKLPSVTPQEPRWIPVSERLPKEFKTVILSTDKDEVFLAVYLGKMNDGSDCFDDNDGMDWEGNVTAWMPLPKPYREVEE